MTARATGGSALRHLSRAVPFILFIALWQGVSAAHLVNPDFLPSAVAVGTALVRLVDAHEICSNLGTTIFTCFVGLGLGALVGIPLGAAMAMSRRVDSFFSPLIKATYSLPKTALVPLLMLWFGIGGATNIAVVVLAALLPLVVYTYHPLCSWRAPACCCGARERWSTAPSKLDLAGAASCRSAGNYDRPAHRAGFFLCHRHFGRNDRIQPGYQENLMFIYGENGAYDYMFAATISLLVVAYAADRGLVHLSDYLLRWQDSAQRDD